MGGLMQLPKNRAPHALDLVQGLARIPDHFANRAAAKTTAASPPTSMIGSSDPLDMRKRLAQRRGATSTIAGDAIGSSGMKLGA